MNNGVCLPHPPIKMQTVFSHMVLFTQQYFELFVLLLFSGIWLSFVIFFKMPVVFPSGGSIVQFSAEYILPLLLAITIQIAVLLNMVIQKSLWKSNLKKIIFSILYIPFIVIVLFLHFNFKSWMPLIHIGTYDSLFHKIDNLTPLPGFLASLGKMLDWGHACYFLYYFFFFSMFVVSFMAHSVFDTFINFRKVMVGTCLILLFGGVSYWIAPAIGPFIFEPSKLANFSKTQNEMYTAYLSLVHTGKVPNEYFGEAPAAMPSLHVANSLFFLLSAKRSLPWLAVIYIPVFTFIVIIASASKWHYLIDMVFGALLSLLALWIVNKVYGATEKKALFER